MTCDIALPLSQCYLDALAELGDYMGVLSAVGMLRGYSMA